MSEADFKNIVATNIIKYRKLSGMTQMELAEKLNYSDKSISKWERGESLPDFYVINEICDIFKITINDLIDPNEKKTVDNTPNIRKKHQFITAMSVGLACLSASVLFLILKIIFECFDLNVFKPELMFVYAVPASFIVLIVFSCLWWNINTQLISVSGLIWSVALCIFLTFRLPAVVFIFISAAILQVLTILWFSLKKHIKKSGKVSKESSK